MRLLIAATKKVELSSEDVKILLALLKYSLEMCPIETISPEVRITSDKIEDLIAKLGQVQ